MFSSNYCVAKKHCITLSVGITYSIFLASTTVLFGLSYSVCFCFLCFVFSCTEHVLFIVTFWIFFVVFFRHSYRIKMSNYIFCSGNRDRCAERAGKVDHLVGISFREQWPCARRGLPCYDLAWPWRQWHHRCPAGALPGGGQWNR